MGDISVCVSSSHVPDHFNVTFVTSLTNGGGEAASFVVQAHRAWSPHGVARLHGLASPECGYFNDTRFYRVIPEWVAQFGGIPRWDDDTVVSALSHAFVVDDDNVDLISNTAGRVAFSAAYSADMTSSTNRTAELFINYQDNSALDAIGFSPIAEVDAEGLRVVRALYSGYGEMRDACDLHGFTPCLGPDSELLYGCGNLCLDDEYPLLSSITHAFVSGEKWSSSLEEGHHGEEDTTSSLPLLWYFINGSAMLVVVGAIGAGLRDHQGRFRFGAKHTQLQYLI
jgi:peptidyl-prolyl cis-trans isomerase A (cyclophilin A)